MMPAYTVVFLLYAWHSPKSFPWVFLFNPQKTEGDAIITPTELMRKLWSQEFSKFPKATQLESVGAGVEPRKGTPELS